MNLYNASQSPEVYIQGLETIDVFLHPRCNSKDIIVSIKLKCGRAVKQDRRWCEQVRVCTCG